MKCRLLPFMEQQPMYNAINMYMPSYMVNAGAETNTTVAYSTINTFLCPSDTNPGSTANPGTNYPNNLGLNRYYNNWECQGPAWYLGNDANLGRIVTFASVTDGLSNTAFFSEFVKGTGRGIGTGSRDSRGMVYTMSNTNKDFAGTPTGRLPARPGLPQQWHHLHLGLQGSALDSR